MKLQLIRNATLLLDYAGHHILIDPFFAPKYSRPSYVGSANGNPLVDLPIPPEEILKGVQLVLVSHLHSDHFDSVAQERVPKDLPLFCQPGNESFIREKGFTDVTPVTTQLEWGGISITHIGGHHGTGEVEAMMGGVIGFLLHAEGEPTLYWAGDTILCDEVRDAITTYQPDVVLTHSSGAMWPDSANQRSLIVMDDQQTVEVCRLLPAGIVIAVHLDSLDHGTVSREQLRRTAQSAAIDESQLRIPADGEVLNF